jgi:serine/threonine protein kinase
MASLEQIETVFHQALRMDDPALRREWLAERCAGDAALLAEVESLLEANDAASSDVGGAEAEEAPVIPDEQFGPYRAIRLLGRGGMSAVYLAERIDGRFDKTVAVKVMAAHLAGSDFRRRFETEGRFLAALRHPHITSLLDGGVSSSGHPYLAMEYVEGLALDEDCDRRNLNLEERLRLFLQVADAVDYAHRSLILHRDLKPGNILVTRDGNSKLLDFGTAALLSGSTAVTVTRGRMMTPRYASPEQLRGERPGIGSDVFSLGVILYELLTGAWPYGDPNSVLSELERIAGDVSPARPASVVTEDAAVRRSTSCERLRRVLAGDLSAVMLKALEDQPARRYLTVRELANDLERYLDGRPVKARAQTALYRFGKFVRRRWIAVGVTSMFIAAIGAAAVVTGLEAHAARAEALKSDQVNRFLTEMLATNDTDQSDVGKYTVEQMLEAADRRLQNAQAKDAQQGSIGGPLTLAVLHKSLAASYLAQQRYDKVAFHLDRAIPVFRAAGDGLELAQALGIQANAETDQGHYREADGDYQEALAQYRRLGNSAPLLEVFDLKRRYAQLLSLLMNTRPEEARAVYDDLLAMGARNSSIPRVAVAMVMAERGSLLFGQQKPEEYEAAMLEALTTGRKEDPGGLWEADPLFNLTVIYGRAHKYQAGKEAAQRLMDVDVRNVGPNHLRTAQARNIWATFAAETGEAEAAANAVRESMPVIEKKIFSPSLNLWFAARNASNVMRAAGYYAEAEHYARVSLAVVQAAHLAEKDSRAANSWEALGRALCEEKKYAEGILALEQAAVIYDRSGAVWTEKTAEIRRLLTNLRVTAN